MHLGWWSQAKKLIEAAEYWCVPKRAFEANAIADDLAAFGLPPDAFDSVETETNDHFEVFEENWPTVLVFLDCQTQWRKEVPGMASKWIWHGLRYSDCDVVIRHHGHRGEKAREVFQGLLIMERAALPILNSGK